MVSQSAAVPDTSLHTSELDKLILVDGHSLLYRAYHAFPALTDPQGRPSGAVYGFTRMLLTTLRDQEPQYVAVAFDHPKPTFRHQDFAAYKAQRAPMPDDLRPQVSLVKDIVRALGVPQFELEGFEADDIIGTLATQAAEPQQRGQSPLFTLIMTGDRDAFQLVNDFIHVWMPGKGNGNPANYQEFDRQLVKTKMGVWPEQIIDLKALMGDSSDNIPGVPGIGAKTATTLLTTFADLEEVITAAENSDPRLPAAAQRKLLAGRDSAIISQHLAKINCDVPIKLDLDACQIHGYDKEQAMATFATFGFNSLVPLLQSDQFAHDVQAALF